MMTSRILLFSRTARPPRRANNNILVVPTTTTRTTIRTSSSSETTTSTREVPIMMRGRQYQHHYANPTNNQNITPPPITTTGRRQYHQCCHYYRSFLQTSTIPSSTRSLFTEAYSDRLILQQRVQELLLADSSDKSSCWNEQDWLDAEQLLHTLVMYNNTSNDNCFDNSDSESTNTGSFDNIELMMMGSSNSYDDVDNSDDNKEFKFRGLIEPVQTSLDLLDRCRIEYERRAQQTINNDDQEEDDSTTSSSVMDFVDSSIVHATVLQWHRAIRLYAELDDHGATTKFTNKNHKMTGSSSVDKNTTIILSPEAMVSRLDRWNTSMKNASKNKNNASTTRQRVMGKTWTCVVDASARMGRTELASLLLKHVLLKSGYIPSPGTVRVVLQAYAAHGGQIQQCHDLIHSIITKTLPQYEQRAVASAAVSTGSYFNDDDDGDTASYNGRGVQNQNQNYQLPPFPLDIYCYNALLQAYAYHGQAEQAEQLLEEICQGLHPMMMPENNHNSSDKHSRQQQSPVVTIRPNILTFNVVLNAWSRSKADDAPERAQGLLMRLYDPFDYGALSDTVQPDAVTFNTVLHCWTSSRRPDAAAQAHALLRERQEWRSRCDANDYDDAAPTVEAFGCVLDAYAKSGNPSAAETLFDELLQTYLNTGNERLRPNLQTMTPLIEAWLNNKRRPRSRSSNNNDGDGGGDSRIEKAENVLRRMHQLHDDGILEQGPDRTAYHVFLNGYANYYGGDVQAGLGADAILQEMMDLSTNDPNLKPSFTTYSLVIQTWAKLPGGLERAKELLEEVLDMYDKTKGEDDLYRPDARSMDSIVQNLAKSGYTEYATQLLHRMVEEEWTANNKMKGTLHSAAFGSVIIALKNQAISDPEAPHKAQALVDHMAEWHHQSLLKKGPDYLLYRALLGCWTKSAEAKTKRNNIKRSQDRQDEALAKALVTLNYMRSKARQGVWQNPERAEYNFLLKILSRSYHPRKADRLLQEMIRDFIDSREKGNNRTVVARPDLLSFHNVLWGYAHCIGNDEALLRIEAILDQMEQLNEQYHQLDVLPDTIAYNNLLHCLSNIATIEAAQRAETVLQQMVSGGGRRESTKSHNNIVDRNHKTQPSPVSYQCVIDTWLRCSSVSQAERVLELFYQDCLDGVYESPYEKPFATVAKAWLRESRSLLSSNKSDEARAAKQRAQKVRQWWDQLHVEQNQKGNHNRQPQEQHQTTVVAD